MPFIMNQHLDAQIFSLTPDSRPSALEATLADLLVPGNIQDGRLNAYCKSLQDRFNLFCSTCPPPQWHKGLIITAEIRSQTENYLPLAEIQAAFRYLLQRSCRHLPFLPAVPIFSALSWADALERLSSSVFGLNPALTIAAVAADQTLRTKVLAALFIPNRYGGSRERYPLQSRFLQKWLHTCGRQPIAALDAACGSGEGVYELAAVVANAGCEPHATTVHGCTVEPLELVAAARGWFPHDTDRAAAVKSLMARPGCRGSIRFFREDICWPIESSVRYDVVVCNGLLGGPLLHEITALEAAVKGLAQRLKKGGIILAADRFHSGWRRVIPLSKLELLFVEHGIRLMELPEGIGGIRT